MALRVFTSYAWYYRSSCPHVVSFPRPQSLPIIDIQFSTFFIGRLLKILSSSSLSLPTGLLITGSQRMQFLVERL